MSCLRRLQAIKGLVSRREFSFFVFPRPVRIEPTDSVEAWQVGNMLEFGERVVREDECLECLERSDAARRLGQFAMARIQDCTTRDGSALQKRTRGTGGACCLRTEQGRERLDAVPGSVSAEVVAGDVEPGEGSRSILDERGLGQAAVAQV